MATGITDQLRRAIATDQLSAHSIKFYDGTYKWNAEGFWDEDNHYRPFGEDPECCPPTPLPPAAYSDLGDDGSDDAVITSPVQKPSVGPGIRQQKQQHVQTYTGLRGGDNGDASDFFSARQNTLPPQLRSTHLVDEEITEINGHVQAKILPRKDLFQNRDGLTRDRLYGRLEGMLLGFHLSNDASLEKAYDMVNVPYPDDITELAELAQKKNESTAGFSGGNGTGGLGEPTKSPFADISGMSDVSDPPSGLEDDNSSQLVVKLVFESDRLRAHMMTGGEQDPLQGAKQTAGHKGTTRSSRRQAGQKASGGQLSASFTPVNKRQGQDQGHPDSDEDSDRPKKGKGKAKDDHGSNKTKRKRDDDHDEDDNSGDGEHRRDNGNPGTGEHEETGAPRSSTQKPHPRQGGSKMPKYSSAQDAVKGDASTAEQGDDEDTEPDMIENTGIKADRVTKKQQKVRAGASKAKKGVARRKSSSASVSKTDSKASKSVKETDAAGKAVPSRRSSRLSTLSNV